MADETSSLSALIMDRGLPVGNSAGSDGRRALHTRVTAGKLVTEAFDSVYATYPDSVTEVYTYQLAASTVATVTVIYTDSTKANILSVVKS